MTPDQIHDLARSADHPSLADLAEALALLRKARVAIYYDVKARSEAGSSGEALESDIGLLQRTDALLARHPAPEAP